MYQILFELQEQLLKSLANSKRLEIIQLLRDRELSVSEIQTMLDLPQCNLSQHLKVLRNEHVVTTRRKGKVIYYSIAHNNFIKAYDLFREVLIENHKREIGDVVYKKMTDLVPLTKDPVCGMRVSPKTSAFSAKQQTTEIYFCGSGCLDKFKKRPTKYLPK
jgi:DNA-binding transcriptional ArsR family regulator/YHS domain-containing protein